MAAPTTNANVNTMDVSTTDINIDYLTNIQSQNEEMIGDITDLQNIEKELYNQLELISANKPVTDEDAIELKSNVDKLIEKINNISDMRMNLYRTLQKNYTFYQNNVAGARETIIEQTTAINIVNDQLEKSKENLRRLQDEKNSKLRSIEINTYYGKQYDDYTNIMKIIIYMCIPIIILTILEKSGLIPNAIYSWLFIIVMVVGIYSIGWKIMHIVNKSRFDYDVYDWFFNIKNAPAANGDFAAGLSVKGVNPFAPYCFNGTCCSDGTVFDSSLGVCKVR
jgi:hypothetical protein